MLTKVLKSCYLDRATFRGVFSLLLTVLLFSLLVNSNAGQVQPRTANQSQSLLFSSFREGEILRIRGEYGKALPVFMNCLKLASILGDHRTELDILLGLALANWNIGNLKESSEYYIRALALAKRNSDIDKADLCIACLDIFRLYQEGKTLRSSDKLPLAILSFNKAIDYARKIHSPDHEAKCLRQLSVIYWDQNDYKEFFSLNNRGLKLSILINNKKEEGRCLNNLGLYYWKIENYSSALDHYKKSLTIAEKEGSIVDQADALHNSGIIWTYIGNYEKALDYLFKAYALDKNLSSKTNLALDLNTIGMALIRKGILSEDADDFIRALRYFNNALEFATEANDKRTEIKILNNIGSAESHLNSYAEALNYFNIAMKKAQENNDTSSLGMILNNIGIVYSNLGNFEESTKFYEQAIKLALGINSGDILWEAYLEIGNSLRSQGKYEEAITNYANSIHVIEEIRTNIVQEELKATYMGTGKTIDAYYNLIDLLATLSIDQSQRDSGIQAYNYLERAKARAFLDSLEVAGVSVANGTNSKLTNQEKQIMQEISQLYTKLLIPTLGPDDKATIEALIKTQDDKLDAIKRLIRTTSPAYSNLKYPEIITYDEVRKTLVEPHTTFLAYSLGKERSFGFAISKKGLKIFRAPSRKILQQQIIEYRKIISDKDSQDFRLGRTLYEELVGPAISKLTRRVIIVPDDALNLLPFETLLVAGPERKWLVEDCAVSYVPSLSVLRELVKRKNAARSSAQKDLLAFGDPYYGANENSLHGPAPDLFQDFYLNPSANFFRLKYSGLEVEHIASSLKSPRARVFERKEATEERLKAEKLSDFKIIHFATHGLIDDKRPARSSIILALDEDPSEDGFLQMREIFNLKMNAELVVLSACQTGLGQFIRGEGIEGLSRAFFYAGASSVLMSLWAVNDQATWQLMERFYRHLESSEMSTTALREAKLEMIRSKVFSHPFYWAGFILTGKTDNVIFKRGIRGWAATALPVLAGMMLLAAIWSLKRRRR